MAEQPSVEAARPARCPACGNAARPTGGTLGLHGHGSRRRQLRGPLEANGESAVHEVKVRRYVCTACEATMTVAPATVLTKRLYLASTMALAFVLLGARHLAQRAVRVRLSAWKMLGEGSSSRWDALLDWLNAVRERRLFPAVEFSIAESAIVFRPARRTTL
jgi:hypothetical protein